MSILSAGVLVLACVLTLVAVDVGRALVSRAHAQTAADAAALAAAQELAIPSGQRPTDAAAEFAADNGAALVSCRCEPGSTEAIVEVSVPVHLVFLGGDRTVAGLARAVVVGTTLGHAHG